MDLNELLERQEKERLQFMAAQIKEWEKLQASHDRIKQSGNDHFPEYQERMEKDKQAYNAEWHSETGKHGIVLNKRHEMEREKLVRGALPPEPEKNIDSLVKEQKAMLEKKQPYKQTWHRK